MSDTDGKHDGHNRCIFGLMIGREPEMRRLRAAIQNRESQLIWGRSDAGKTFVIQTASSPSLPEAERRKCIYWTGAASGRQLIEHFMRGLYLAGDPLVRQKVHADRAGEFTLDRWINQQSAFAFARNPVLRPPNMAITGSSWIIFPSPTHKMAHFLKEIMYRMQDAGLSDWTRLLSRRDRTCVESVLDRRISHPSGTADRSSRAGASGDLHPQIRIESLDLEGFRDDILHFSGRLPGSIVKMCELAADPRYHYRRSGEGQTGPCGLFVAWPPLHARCAPGRTA